MLKKLSIFNFVLAILLGLNIFIFHSPVLGVILGLGFIVLSSYLLGNYFCRDAIHRVSGDAINGVSTLLKGFILFLCTIILPLTIIYYFYQLNDRIIVGFLVLLSIILLPAAGFQTCSQKKQPVWAQVRIPAPGKNFWLLIIYLLILIISYILLKSGATLESVRTPWQFVSKWFFVGYFLSTAVLIYLIKHLKTSYTLILSSLHLFFTFSVANIIFPLGFGFDMYIHQATEKYILEHGFILPKPFYYLGQYSLVVFLTKLFQISHVIIDKNLVPGLAAILLPGTIYYSFKNIKIQEYKNKFFLFTIHYSLFIFLIIPFTIFTFTTPQNLADLLVIVIAFLGLAYYLNSKTYNLILISLLSLTTLVIHPIAGLAAIIFSLVLWTQKCKVWHWLKIVFLCFLCFCVFCVFVLFSFLSPLYKVDIVNNFNLVDFYNNIFRWSPDLFLNTNFVHLLKTIVYFLWQPFILFLTIFLLAIYGLFLYRRNKALPCSEQGNALFLQLPLVFVILFINSLIIFSFLKFGFLVSYERGDFAWRIFNLGVYFLIPLAIYSITLLLYYFIIKCRKKSFILFLLILMISLGVTASLYFSYPRNDVYYYTRGFNTSVYDFNAVKYIEENTNQPYVVLANQQVGVAALTTYGFRYFNDIHFFYSIPRGSDLYNIFHKIAYNEEISREIIKPVKELTGGVDIVYFYLNDYWFNFKIIAPELMKIADETIVLENGKVWIFKFSF